MLRPMQVLTDQVLPALAGVFLAGSILWSALAIYYWNRGALVWRRWLAGGWAFFWLALMLGSHCNPIGLIAYGFAFGILLLAWLLIPARRDLIWESWHEHQARGEIEGDLLRIHDLRNFRWKSRTEAEPNWEVREYDLSTLRGMDFVTSSWGLRGVVHTLVSFQFGESDYLCLSIETRLERDEGQNPLAGLFKQYELVYLFTDERDALALRTNIRLEETRVYPTTLSPDKARQLLTESVADANGLEERPRFYNTLWRNCLTSFMPRLGAHHKLSFDLRLIFNAGFDAYGIERGLIDTDLPIDRAREVFAADDHGRSSHDMGDYSRRIRPWRYEQTSPKPSQPA